MMAIDLLKGQINSLASYLVARLCDEAGVCQTGNEYGNTVDLHCATYDVENGLVVTDGKGRRFRLKIEAEELP